MSTPKQITVRNPSPALARRIKEIARARGESMNSTILRLLEQVVGIDARRQRLEEYADWDDEEYEEFSDALESQRQIDEEMWK